MDKKEAARILYLNGYSHEDIGSITKTSPNTIGKWSSQFKWREERLKQQFQESTSQDRIWTLINEQLMVLEKIAYLNKDNIKNCNDPQELKKYLIPRGDIDAFQKLYTTTKGKELAWDGIVKISQELMEHVEKTNLDLAKELAPLVHDWLHHKRELT